jgi:hypothetical protein
LDNLPRVADINTQTILSHDTANVLTQAEKHAGKCDSTSAPGTSCWRWSTANRWVVFCPGMASRGMPSYRH